MQDLGTLDGGTVSDAWDINPSGEVVGVSNISAGVNRAFLYVGGKMQDLGTLGGDASYANRINDAGDVVGTAQTSAGTFHPFLIRNGVMHDLGTLPGDLGAGASDINNKGQIVGDSGTRAFIYSDGRMTDLDSLLLPRSAWRIEGPVINDSGEIAALGYFGSEVGKPRAILLTPVTGPLPKTVGIGFVPNSSGLPSSKSSGLTGPRTSADGVVVAGSGANLYVSKQAMRFTVGDGMSGLGLLPAGTYSYSEDISKDGNTIVGTADISENGQSRARAFSWNASMPIQQYDPLGGDNESRGFGVSPDGSVIVGASYSASGPTTAVTWDVGTATPAHVLVPLSGDLSAVARRVTVRNAVTTIIGESVDPASGTTHAVRWTDGGAPINLGSLMGALTRGAYAEANDLSADGAVIVGSSDSAQGRQAYRWTLGTGMIGLGNLPGGSGSTACGINADGSVVVGYSEVAGQNEAFVWDALSGMRDLAGIAAANGYDLAGWHLMRATDVSADGSTIVGFGIDPQGYTEAFSITVPEPTAALVVAFFGMSCLRRLRG